MYLHKNPGPTHYYLFFILSLKQSVNYLSPNWIGQEDYDPIFFESFEEFLRVN